MEEALAALDRAIRCRRVYENYDQGFAAKYANASTEALQEAYKLVKAQLKATQDSIAKERMSLGLFETTVATNGENAPRLKGRTSGKPSAVTAFTEPGGGGSTITRTVEINPEEYPEFDAVSMELWWLARTLRHRSAVMNR